MGNDFNWGELLRCSHTKIALKLLVTPILILSLWEAGKRYVTKTRERDPYMIRPKLN